MESFDLGKKQMALDFHDSHVAQMGGPVSTDANQALNKSLSEVTQKEAGSAFDTKSYKNDKDYPLIIDTLPPPPPKKKFVKDEINPELMNKRLRDWV